MASLLVKNIHTLVTMDDARREIHHASLLVDGPAIAQLGATSEIEAAADEILDLKGHYIVLPGLINTHHHFYQVLTRAVPGAQDCELFGWLQTLYPIWTNLTAKSIYLSSQMAAAELMLSGCTTSSDHLYLFPNDCTLDCEIQAIREIGMRFHATRGSMSVGVSQGGLPPDSLVEQEATILKDSQRLIEEYHDNSRYSMLRIALAPCSPFSVSTGLMKDSAALARSYAGVRLHTHLAENESDVSYSLEKFGLTPGQYAESLGWVGEDVWHAHCVQLDAAAIKMFGRTRTGVAHCPCSNLRLGSGIAPIRAMRAAGVPVGLGVDGSASNDGGNLLQEARTACLVARGRERDARAMSPRAALELATRGGADVLGRQDIGYLAPGMAADFIAIDIDTPQFVGAWDKVAALILCQAHSVDYSFIGGKRVIDEGRLVTVDIGSLMERTNEQARLLAAAPESM